MAKPVPIKPEEQFARSYADRLILEQLTEMEAAVKLGELADRLSSHGLGLAAVKSLLASNPDRFAYHERKWVPASRLEAQHRPVAEALRLIIDRFGGPMPMTAVIIELARIRSVSEDDLFDIVRRIVVAEEQFVVTDNDELALASWGFLASDESIDRAFAIYGVDAADVEAAKKKLEGIEWRSPDSLEKALAAAAPISAKTLGAVAWLSLNSQDPKAILLYDGRKAFSRMLSIPGYVFGADGVIYPDSEARKWVSAATKLAERLAPSIEVEDVAPIEVKAEDVTKIVKKVLASESAVTATRILEEMYEITTANKTYPDDMANLMAALRAEKSIWWVGADRFRKPGTAPDYIHSVPAPFDFPAPELLNEEGDPIDIELTDDGLSSTLRKLLSHPLATDVLDEDILPQPKATPERVRLVLKSIHRELGTFPMCQFPTGWLIMEPEIQEFIFVDPNGRELQVWANSSARLMYNLIDWWFEQPVESGAVFTLGKASRPNVFEFAWEDQTDPLLYVSSQRMDQLREMQSRSEGMSTLDILVEVMHHWPKGADFLTLLAEVNVVRRTTRRMVASLLSSYQCFYQRSGSPVWHFDNKKVDLGFDKTKKKFVKK